EPDFDPDHRISAEVVAVIRAAAMVDRVLLSSFDLAAVDAVRRLDPAVATAWLTLAGYDQHEALELCAARGHRALHPHQLGASPALVDAAHRAGLAVNVWTVDDPDRMAELAGWGVAGLLTNYP